MILGSGPLLVFERRGVGELLFGLRRTRRGSRVQYFRAIKIAARRAARKPYRHALQPDAAGEAPA